MPRKYKPDPTKKQYRKYDPSILTKAVQELSSTKLTLKDVAKKYNISISVLYRHSKKDIKPQGGQTALSKDDEQYVVDTINACAEYPLDKIDLRCIVKMFLDKLGIVHKRFKNNMPGPDFVEGFLNRHRDKISHRICQNIKRSRAALSPDTIKKYHAVLQKTLEGVPLTHIVNYDETNLTDDPGQKRVLTKCGHKYLGRVMNHSISSTSLMMAGTAAGELLTPYLVFKADGLYDTGILEEGHTSKEFQDYNYEEQMIEKQNNHKGDEVIELDLDCVEEEIILNESNDMLDTTGIELNINPMPVVFFDDIPQEIIIDNSSSSSSIKNNFDVEKDKCKAFNIKSNLRIRKGKEDKNNETEFKVNNESKMKNKSLKGLRFVSLDENLSIKCRKTVIKSEKKIVPIPSTKYC